MAGPTTTFQTGVHASRPAASAGCVLYACTTHSKVYRSDGSAWTDWMTIPTGASMATDPIWDAAGDLAVGSGADTAAKLAIGATGKVLQSNGTTATWVYPPGYQLDRVQITSPVAATHTTEATADIVVTSNSVTFDGTECCFEFYSPAVDPTNTAGAYVILLLFDNTASTSASIGRLALIKTPAANTQDQAVFARRFITPAAGARTYSVRAIVSGGTGNIVAGAGATSDYMPAYLRITKS